MVVITKAETKTFEYDGKTYSVSFNGKIYNGKRYFDMTYRLNNTKSGLRSSKYIWQDGFGWFDGGNFEDEIAQVFGLEA